MSDFVRDMESALRKFGFSHPVLISKRCRESGSDCWSSTFDVGGFIIRFECDRCTILIDLAFPDEPSEFYEATAVIVALGLRSIDRIGVGKPENYDAELKRIAENKVDIRKLFSGDGVVFVKKRVRDAREAILEKLYPTR